MKNRMIDFCPTLAAFVKNKFSGVFREIVRFSDRFCSQCIKERGEIPKECRLEERKKP